MHLSWNTVARWLERAAEAAERFSARLLRGYMLTELQADEIRTFIMNTAFIERLNLTIRQGSAYLCRKTPCHARNKEYLDDHLELLRSYYNFVRFHRALKFGQERRTPAMQAGLVSKQLSFRDIFMATARFVILFVVLIDIPARLHNFRSTRSAA